jgi:hypothetical protein
MKFSFRTLALAAGGIFSCVALMYVPRDVQEPSRREAESHSERHGQAPRTHKTRFTQASIGRTLNAA